MLNMRIHTALQGHTCTQCGRKIAVGEKYMRFIRCNNRKKNITHFIACAECAKLAGVDVYKEQEVRA